MNIDRERLAWAGGFFSGEGCCHISTNTYGRKRKYLRLTVVNTSKQALDRFYGSIGRLGGMNEVPYQRGNYKPTYQWRVANFEEAQQVICLLWIFLSEEKKHDAKTSLKQCLQSYQAKPVLTNDSATGRFCWTK